MDEAILESLAYRVAELERRLGNVVRPGVVAEANYTEARVRVRVGELVTGWLPWLTRRAGGDVDWWAPEVGEQVVMVAPSGELAAAWVLPAGYSDAVPAPADTADVWVVRLADGAELRYDRAASQLTVSLPGDAQVTIDGDAAVSVGGSATVDVGGDLAATAGGQATVDAPSIHLNGGTGVVTGASICHFTGSPHGDVSATVTAGK